MDHHEDSQDDQGAKPSATRRQLVLGSAVAVLAATGAGGYYLWSRPSAVIGTAAAQTTGQAEVSESDLMTPGPLGDQVQGSPDAPVTIIEYASMTCPHCAHFHETTYPELKRKYIDTGKVRFIFREFPLDPLAAAGSMLARCAGKEKYFPMVESLFAQQKDWVTQKPLQPMLGIAKQAGFTQESFDKCLANQQMLDGIEASRTRASEKFNVNSTPTFFINGKIYRGALTPEELDKQLAPYLKGT
jgi:protein-disulfide isomerase